VCVRALVCVCACVLCVCMCVYLFVRACIFALRACIFALCVCMCVYLFVRACIFAYVREGETGKRQRRVRVITNLTGVGMMHLSEYITIMQDIDTKHF